MLYYVLLEAIAGIVGAILIAISTPKKDGVVYGRLDNVGRVTNVLLTFFYVIAAPFCMFIGLISEPGGEGLLWILGLIVCLITASAVLFCGLGIGFSVALRKKGKSALSFAVQFAGVIGILLTVLLYGIFEGSLIGSLN